MGFLAPGVVLFLRKNFVFSFSLISTQLSASALTQKTRVWTHFWHPKPSALSVNVSGKGAVPMLFVMMAHSTIENPWAL